MKTHKKNIACLESMWDAATENRLNVVPVLDIISRVWGVKFSHLNCNTHQELLYNLALLRKRNYGILSFAFHGSKGAIELHDGTRVGLDELSEMMGDQFAGWVIHFGSCNTIKISKSADSDALQEWIKATQVAAVAGYTTAVDWVESSAMDMLFFQGLQHYKSLSALWLHLQKAYPDLIGRTGFRVQLR